MYVIGTITRAFVILFIFISPILSSNSIIFGLLFGSASGIFWTGNAMFSLQISKSTKRFNFLSIVSSISSISGLIAPTLGGILIEYSTNQGIFKYLNDFILASALLLVSGLIGLSISTSGEKGGRLKISNTVIRDKNYGKFRLLFIASSILNMAISTLIPVYVYYISDSYVIAGIYGTITGIIGFISNSSAPFIKSKMKRYVPIAILLVITTSVLIVVRSIVPLYIIIFSASVILFFLGPLSNLGMDQFMHYLDNFSRTRHFWINREYYLIVGRFTALFSILVISEFYSINTAVLTIPFLSLSVLGYIPVLGESKKDLEKKG